MPEQIEVVVNDKPVWDEHWSAWEIGYRGGEQILVYDFMATSAIIIPDGEFSYENRRCFETTWHAMKAALVWLRTGTDEPEGWHRHLPSNRRREHRDATTEYVQP